MMMKKRLSMFVLFMLAACAAMAQQKLNVLVLLVDDLGWADLGYEGSSFYETPNIDALSRDGLKFSRAYAACPVCSPSRAAIMTGRYPQRTGITDFINESKLVWDRNTRLLPARNKLFLDLKENTLGELMKSAGYTTYFAGKWHLGMEGYWPENQGFDINMGGCSAGHPKSYFAPYGNPRLTDGPKGEYLPERLANETVKFIHAHKHEPFLIYHSFYLVHTPLQPKPVLRDKYQHKRDSLKLGDSFDSLGADVFHEMPFRTVRSIQSHTGYAAMVEALDQGVGQIIQALKDEGLYNNTLIIFTSDNGGLSTSERTPTSNYPLKGGKGFMYEGGIRVPLIIRWPHHTKPGTSTEALAWGPDLMPTIAGITGIKIPATWHLDGHSLMPALSNKPEARTLFWHYPHYGNQGGNPSNCIMDGDWKLIHWYDPDRYELYNVKNDIGEKHNLYGEQPERAAALKKKLEAWLKNVQAQYPTTNPKFKG